MSLFLFALFLFIFPLLSLLYFVSLADYFLGVFLSWCRGQNACMSSTFSIVILPTRGNGWIISVG